MLLAHPFRSISNLQCFLRSKWRESDKTTRLYISLMQMCPNYIKNLILKSEFYVYINYVKINEIVTA